MTVTTAHVTSQSFVDRSTQEPDVLYVDTNDDAVFMTPDGVGRIWLMDADQTVNLTLEEAIAETGITDVVEVDHVCDNDVCDLTTRNYCRG